jgi:hypothetical protein
MDVIAASISNLKRVCCAFQGPKIALDGCRSRARINWVRKRGRTRGAVENNVQRGPTGLVASLEVEKVIMLPRRSLCQQCWHDLL